MTNERQRDLEQALEKLLEYSHHQRTCVLWLDWDWYVGKVICDCGYREAHKQAVDLLADTCKPGLPLPKCTKCGTEMVYVSPEKGMKIYYDIDEINSVYECPSCKRLLISQLPPPDEDQANRL